LQIWENGNISDLENIMVKDAIYEAAQQNYSYKGIEEIGKYVGHVHSFSSDLKIEIISINSTKEFSVLEWVMTGIQDRPIPGHVLIGTNREFRLKGITMIEIKDGRIRKATDYMDVLGFVMQLGARVELPGGGVLESK
jgi:steroid delta-isomerase-like uncharacterized protein